MKILLASEYFYPSSKGGTEMYVLQLAKELIRNGHECIVLSLSNDKQKDNYEGVSIVYANYIHNISSEQDNPENFNEIYTLVKEINPDVFHLHTLTPSLGVNHLVKLKAFGIKVVFTAHITNFTCTRGDLMLYGEKVCDGYIDRNRCMDCYLQSKKINNVAIRKSLIGMSKLPFSSFFNKGLGVVGKKINELHKLQNTLNHLVVVSQWQQKVIELNRLKFKGLSVCRQAVPSEIMLTNKKHKVGSKIKIGFIGRIVKVKGLHYLLDILLANPSIKVDLLIAAIKSNNEIEYYDQMKQKSDELGASWMENLSADAVIELLDEMDLLVVPSVWLETGPFVIYEALARKIPVLAFNKGGAVELITNNKNGWLVENTQELEEKIKMIVANPSNIELASNEIESTRTTHQLYKEIIEVYNQVQIN